MNLLFAPICNHFEKKWRERESGNIKGRGGTVGLGGFDFAYFETLIHGDCRFQKCVFWLKRQFFTLKCSLNI